MYFDHAFGGQYSDFMDLIVLAVFRIKDPAVALAYIILSYIILPPCTKGSELALTALPLSPCDSLVILPKIRGEGPLHVTGEYFLVLLFKTLS